MFDAILHCQHFSESDAMEAMRQLGLALVYLHANTIVHRGVKPENIFVSNADAKSRKCMHECTIMHSLAEYRN